MRAAQEGPLTVLFTVDVGQQPHDVAGRVHVDLRIGIGPDDDHADGAEADAHQGCAHDHLLQDGILPLVSIAQAKIDDSADDEQGRD